MKKKIIQLLIISFISTVFVCFSNILFDKREKTDSPTETLTPSDANEITQSDNITNSYDVSQSNNITDSHTIPEVTKIMTSSDATNTPELTESYFPDKKDLELTILYQYPELPAGCESVSLTMILNYYGYDLYKTEIADNYLIYSGDFVTGYSGNPYSSVGGGCYAPGITETANNFLKQNGNKHVAVNITGTNLDDLLKYIANDTPVLVWSTIGLNSCSKGYSQVTHEGTTYTWDYMEHCVVLTGYNLTNNTVTIYDPIDGIVVRDKDRFEEIYNEMYKMSMILE